MKIKKFLIVLLFACFSAALFVASCAPTEIRAGKYCAEGNEESYIEVYDNETLLFVNVDFSQIENDAIFKQLNGDINISELFGNKPQKYYFSGVKDDEHEGCYWIIVDVTEYSGINLFWSDKDNSLKLGDVDIIYKLQQNSGS